MLILNVQAQQPSLFTYTPTNSSGTFYGQAQVNSAVASPNDWIAAFDASGVCAGANQIIFNSGVAYINLVIYGDDATTTTIDEGMSGNEDFTLKLYQSSSGVYLDYPSSSSVNNFSDWVNTNGAPMPSYSTVTNVYDFSNSSVVTFSLNVNLCENSSPILLSGGQPSGGVYSGNGVVNGYFDPSISGNGVNTITYTYNGGVATAMIEVFELSDANLLSTGPYCENESAIPLVSATIGGVYSGSGVISNTFNPSIVGAGSYWVTYTLTDTNNCMQEVETLIAVNQAPVIPVINQLSNNLECITNGVTYQWYDSGMNAISGATNQTYSPVLVGEYYVEVSNGDCSEISNGFNYSISSVNQKNNQFDIILLENEIHIKSEFNNFSINIFDINGQLIYSETNISIIKTNMYNKGVYLILIEENNKIICEKIIL